MDNPPNSEAAEFWSGPSGQSWIDNQTEQDALLFPVVDVILSRADLKPGDRVLDIGCGTGALSLACGEIVGPSGHVLACDISEPLLTRTAERSAHLAQNSTFLADAQIADWPDTGFDIAVSRFGVMFFSNPTAAFANIARALKPGGRMVFAAWGPYASNPWWMIPQRVAADRLGQPPKVPPHSPGPMGLSDMDWALDQFRDAGLQDVRGEAVEITMRHPEGNDAMASLGTRIGPARRVINHFSATADDIAAIESAIKSELAPYGDAGVPATLHLLSARKG